LRRRRRSRFRPLKSVPRPMIERLEATVRWLCRIRRIRHQYEEGNGEPIIPASENIGRLSLQGRVNRRLRPRTVVQCRQRPVSCLHGSLRAALRRQCRGPFFIAVARRREGFFRPRLSCGRQQINKPRSRSFPAPYARSPMPRPSVFRGVSAP